LACFSLSPSVVPGGNATAEGEVVGDAEERLDLDLPLVMSSDFEGERVLDSSWIALDLICSAESFPPRWTAVKDGPCDKLRPLFGEPMGFGSCSRIVVMGLGSVRGVLALLVEASSSSVVGSINNPSVGSRTKARLGRVSSIERLGEPVAVKVSSPT
jgi:hypothetical protein